MASAPDATENERERGHLLDDLAALAALLSGLILLTWPAMLDRNRVLGHYDAGFNHLATEHLQDVVLRGASWRDAPLGWPLGYGTANADWQAGQALLDLPLRLAGVDPSRAALLLAFAGLLSTGFLGHRLARALLGRGPHTWLAGLGVGLSPVCLSHLQHVNLIHHELMIGGALLLGAGLSKDNQIYAGFGAAALGLSFHLGMYMGVHAALVGAALVGAAALARQGSRPTWTAALIGGGLAALTVLPVFKMYSDADDYLNTSVEVTRLTLGSWDPTALLSPNGGSWLQGLVGGGDGARFAGNPGYLMAALALFGAIRGEGTAPRWAWRALVGVAGLTLLLALGPTVLVGGQPTGVPGPYALFAALPGLENLQEPHRWLMVGFMALALLAAAGLRALTAALPSPIRALVALLAMFGVLAETPRVGTADPRYMAWPQVYGALLTLNREGALWDHLRVAGERTCACDEGTVMRAALLHRRPLIALYSARRVSALEELRADLNRWPHPSAAQRLGTLRVVAVIKHPPFDPGVPEGWMCQDLDDHRLCITEEPWTLRGLGHPPPYTGQPEGADWLPPLPVRTR